MIRSWLRTQTARMSRGVDTTLFTPERPNRNDSALNIGYVGAPVARRGGSVQAAHG